MIPDLLKNQAGSFVYFPGNIGGAMQQHLMGAMLKATAAQMDGNTPAALIVFTHSGSYSLTQA